MKPKLRFLMFTLELPQTKEQNLLAPLQEGVKKAEEKGLGVLFKSTKFYTSRAGSDL